MQIFDAVRTGVSETVKAYLRYGGDVNNSLSNGSTLLMIAATYGQTGVMKILTEAGADVNAVNYGGMTALMYAMLKTSSIETVRFLVDSNADVNASYPRSSSDGSTALMLAVSGGFTEKAEILLRAGANLNARNKYGETALALAVQFGHTELAEFLKSNGAKE